jgi:GTP-binding nuclear protein Ran
MFKSFFGSKPDIKKKVIKLTIIGDGGTGKTCLWNRLLDGDMDDYKFNNYYNATENCNIYAISGKIAGQEITIHLFDTAGQEKFDGLRDSFILGSDGVIVMYSVIKGDADCKHQSRSEFSHNNIDKWLRRLKTLTEGRHPPVVVCGNKTDMLMHVSQSQSFRFRASDLKGYYPNISSTTMSVKSGEKIWDPINTLLRKIYNLDDTYTFEP